MKKVLIASGVALLAFAMVAGAQTTMFNSNLTVGSTGPDVVALQTWLVNNHYLTMPAGVSMGYFGSRTKTAVAAYQVAAGIANPGTGFVGPLTRTKLNGGGATASACPVTGWTQASYNGTTFCVPPGYTAPGTTPVADVSAPGVISTPGIPGTLAVSQWSTPSNGTTVYKGQSYDVATYKVQASASDMAVQSISVDFSTRLWLYAGTITVKDDAGNVVGKVSNLGVSNFTELTVGTDYRITIPVNNYVVKAAATKYLTINLSFLPSSDRGSGTYGIISAQVRSVDGTGVTDTETVNSGNTSTVSDTNSTSVIRSFSYQGSGSGQIIVTVDAASPLQGLATLSTSATTEMIPLAIYDIKSQGAPSTLQSLNLTVNTLGHGADALFSKLSIKIGGNIYSASTLGSTTSFTNLQVPLAADVYTPVTIYGTVAADTNNMFDGDQASTTWTVNGTNLVAVDSSYSNVTVNSGTFVSSTITFSASSAALSGLASTGNGLPNATCSQGSYNGVSGTTACTVNYQYTLTAGNNTLYVSAVPGVSIATTTTGYNNNGATNASTTITSVVANPTSVAGDDTNGTYYVIPAGSSRQFVYTGTMKFDGSSTAAARTFAITKVYYSTGTSNLQSNNINYNLGALKVSLTI